MNMHTLQKAAQMLAALQLYANSLGDEAAMEVAEIYPPWTIGKAYKVDDLVGYGTNGVGDTQLYRCLQAHTSQEDWTPDTATSLWKTVGIDPSGYPEWSQPVGTIDAYMMGDIVSYNGSLYISIVDNNVWAPDVYGWEPYTETDGNEINTQEPNEPEPSIDEPEEPDQPNEPSQNTYPSWISPTGSTNMYMAGDIVSYNGSLYRSTVDNNVWAPDVYGWEPYTE